MTPAQHGYVRCALCGSWRRPEGVVVVMWLGRVNRHHCTSERYCDETVWANGRPETARPAQNDAGCEVDMGGGSSLNGEAARGLGEDSKS